MENPTKKGKNKQGWLCVFLGGETFFRLTLVLAALQAAWFTFSFQPGVFDEQKLLGKIYLYTHHLSPFLGPQNPAWDSLGAVTRDGSYMFYYIMSWPLRFIELFTHNYMWQVIGLRLLCIAFFIGGLIIYRKTILNISVVPQSFVNVVFLVFILIPTVALLPGAVNYDNMVFFIFAIILWYAMKVTKAEKPDFLQWGPLLCLSLFVCVIKWTAIALVLPIAIFLIVDLYKRYGVSLVKKLVQSISRAPHRRRLLIMAGIVVVLGLFIERPALNTVRYGNPDPSCDKVISSTRCMKFADYAFYVNVLSNKPATFHAAYPPFYFLEDWAPKIIGSEDNVFERPQTQLPLILGALTVGTFLSAFLILIYLRDITSKRVHILFLLIITIYGGILFAQDYSAYVHYGVPTAVRARYVVPIAPIWLYFTATAVFKMAGAYRKTLLIVAAGFVLLLTQGGSIITYSLTTPRELYWPNRAVRSANTAMQNFLHPLVKE